MADGGAIVIDTGSYSTKAGFAGDDAPRALFPTVVGHGSETYVGDDAISNRDMLSLSHPIKRGAVTNWDDVEKIWHHTFYKQLNVAPEEHPILLAQAPLTSKTDRERATQLMFETFNAPAVVIALDAALALAQAGRTTGTVVDIGQDYTRIVPVVEGKCESHAISQVDVGGDHITNYLRRGLAGSFGCRDAFEERDTFRAMKEQCCFVALDFDACAMTADTSEDINQDYELPDGQIITIASERFSAPEALFKPDMVQVDGEGIQTALGNSLERCDSGSQSMLAENIVLTGGTAALPGMAQRLQSVVAWEYPSQSVNVTAPTNPGYSAWLGGTMVASSSGFESMWVSKEEYDEEGAAAIHKKYFG